MDTYKVLLIINPVAGKKAAKKALYPIVKSLCDREQMVTVFSTSARGEATRIVMEHAKEYNRIICCGGDGTLNEVLSGILQAGIKVPVGYIPTGTTNDLAHSLKLPTKLNQAIDVAVKGEAKKHDIGLFNHTRYFDYVASFGAFVKTSYTTPQKAKNALGHLAYILYGIPEIFEIRPYKAKIIADGRLIEGSFIFGSVSNATQIAGLITLPAEKINLNDGKFELILVKALTDTAQPLRLPKEDSNGNIEASHFLFMSASTITFSFEDEVEWTVDGEYAGKFKEVYTQNLSSAVEIISKE